jgi:hypothetical protein
LVAVFKLKTSQARSGGLIAEYSTWQWAFWNATVFCTCIQLAFLLFVRGESKIPVARRRPTRARELRAGPPPAKPPY